MGPYDGGEGAFAGRGSARFPKGSEIHIHDVGRRRRQSAQDDEPVSEVWDRERQGDGQTDDDRVSEDDRDSQDDASAKKTEPAKSTASAKKTELAKTTTSTPGTGATPTTTTLTPVQQKLQQNTNLASKLETRLPKGTDLMTAAEGFRNLGQFVAAVNVSNNLGIDFVNLKTSMVDDGLSLGQSIQTWKPTANSTREVSLAESQATVLINTSSTTTTATTTTTAKTRKPKSTSGGELND